MLVEYVISLGCDLTSVLVVTVCDNPGMILCTLLATYVFAPKVISIKVSLTV